MTLSLNFWQAFEVLEQPSLNAYGSQWTFFWKAASFDTS
jgi:hypothetical protein